jgi:hypothetical protein
MFPAVDTKDPTSVEVEVQGAYLEMYPEADALFVPRVFGWALDCFRGHYGDYQAIDARYHDYEHTLQGTLCMCRLLHGRFSAQAEPLVGYEDFQLGILAILLHDTGYLKTRDDPAGTGAKYTLIHVNRSAEFASRFLAEKGFGKADIRAVQNMIRCTGVNVDLRVIPFQSEVERLIGYALGTADLLGQMAAPDYVDKLPILFEEFAESARFNHGRMAGVGNFESVTDLMRRTPLFWDAYVQPKIKVDFASLYHFLNRPYPEGPNEYLQRIEANMERLRRLLPS